MCGLDLLDDAITLWCKRNEQQGASFVVYSVPAVRCLGNRYCVVSAHLPGRREGRAHVARPHTASTDKNDEGNIIHTC